MAIKAFEYGKHVVCESTKLGATNYNGHIYNVELTQDLDNGSLVNIDKMKYLRPEVYSMVAPTAIDRVGLVLQVPLIYEEFNTRIQGEDNFYNESGDICRVYTIDDGDIFSISEIGITAINDTPEKGHFVVADGFGIKEVEAEPTDVAFYGEIVDIVPRTNLTMYKIEVKRNEPVAPKATV